MAQRQVNYLTPEGLAKLSEELEHLKTVRRREIAEQLKRASEVGGTVDNAEYDEARREQSRLEGRILELETLIQDAAIIPDHVSPPNTVQPGSRVTVVNSKGLKSRYVIVGSAEADPLQGKISNVSPIGKALLGKRVGATVKAQTPAGEVQLKVVKIE